MSDFNDDFDDDDQTPELPPPTAKELSTLQRALRADFKKAGAEMGDEEAGFLVATYYAFQKHRLRMSQQAMQLGKDKKPSFAMSLISQSQMDAEDRIRLALDSYSMSRPIGVWAREIYGIGPVIAAGLMAYVKVRDADPETGRAADTCSDTWSLAGLRPGQRRIKGKKLDYNPHLKVLCWKAGESFKKLSKKEKCFYGGIYRQRKAYETRKNEALDYKDQADAKLATEKNDKTTERYGWLIKGMLPPAQIDMRSMRYAVKLMLSHYHDQLFELQFKRKPPAPYPFTVLGHSPEHLIAPPQSTQAKAA